MQINRQIISDFQQRSRYFKAFGTLDSKITMSKFSLILAVCMITFTSLLFTKTLEIQHSCKPMIHYGTLPTECQLAATNNFSSYTQTELKTSKQQPQIAHNPKVSNSETSSSYTKPELKTQSNSVTIPANYYSDDVVGGIVGVATAAGTAAAAAAAGATAAFSVPVAGAVAIGLGVWYTIRTVF